MTKTHTNPRSNKHIKKKYIYKLGSFQDTLNIFYYEPYHLSKQNEPNIYNEKKNSK